MAKRVTPATQPTEYYRRFPRTLDEAYGYRAVLTTESKPHEAWDWRQAARYTLVIILFATIVFGAMAVALARSHA